MKKFIGIYLAIALCFAIYFNFWGSIAERYRGFFYNLWISLIWPILLITGFLKLLLAVVVFGFLLYFILRRD